MMVSPDLLDSESAKCKVTIVVQDYTVYGIQCHMRNIFTYHILRCMLGYTTDQQLHNWCHLLKLGIQVHLISCMSMFTTLHMIFSVTCSLELHNALTINCMSHFFTSKAHIVCLVIIEHWHLYFV
jgi:hypothetical protein